MKKGGIGGAKTRSGLKFEERTSLKNLFESLPDYSVISNRVYFKNKEVAQLYQKHELYRNLLQPNHIDYITIISKKLLPDDSIFVIKNKVLHIIEMKFQEVAGSVDEKLQTCDFKHKQYQKLLSPLKIKVKYVYILNDWFMKKEYEDVLKYVESVGCYYFINILPFHFLDLPTPSK